ncbi:hypothetical protein RhiirA5_369848 [Rhizophagus irregularis]|uniref:Uncharacterized protein n=3 Tax=Rhizophagus irregularis TaxID=588596 RepID=A0A2N0QBM5_9GLOM|nr:hypothetical protein GLOIN_2v1484420 [Rhizophagus irregularis DAOM 181602=DAOM 197198]PKC16482.1 hypothetical protein RhiirA5_369848 [Rhizophagus irregularis]POG63782.1 hypothetical protein GLOIN_2v1484420 [Rhizophagus irregularis DAOM 181602=DAOM 197198]UZO22096.1 hypothetical protein OCT59_014468 [Rhizophagus irregularis]CAB4482843.1 unnamed protein product [Rhizophagus irregularis]CAB5199151.1 unnamed protein product [Rhizophagus irregularis]|eukprot:XP_025170648.1 hypothetical protein GLOIN_2v1484420 [Rhizophagus irregularis DAOM 181602=DAOM 197198]
MCSSPKNLFFVPILSGTIEETSGALRTNHFDFRYAFLKKRIQLRLAKNWTYLILIMSTLILTFKSASATSEVRENFRLVKASDNPAFRQDKKLEWQKFEKFNAKFLALRLSHFKVAGYDKIKLKDLLKGANISEDLLDIEVVLPKKSNCNITKYNEGETAEDNNEGIEGFTKLKNENTFKLKSKESLPDEDTAMTARVRLHILLCLLNRLLQK